MEPASHKYVCPPPPNVLQPLKFQIDERVTLKARFSTAPFYWCINRTVCHKSAANHLRLTYIDAQQM